jgi:predicted membrane-bound spermidine synthase
MVSVKKQYASSALGRWIDSDQLLKRFPVKAQGDVKIDTVEVTETMAVMDLYRYGSVAWTPAGTYVRLYVGKELMMSNTRMEYLTNLPLLQEATGTVLIAGLGLGLIVRELLLKEDVDFIHVVEKNADVVKLVGSSFGKGDIVHFFTDDIYTWKPEMQYDTIYFDIWPDMNYPAIAAKKLKDKYRPYLAKGGRMWAWREVPRAKKKAVHA